MRTGYTSRAGSFHRLTREEFRRRWSAWMKSPGWAAFRSKALAYYGWKCSVCGDDWRNKGDSLQLHHLTYYKNDSLLFGRETLADVRPLCKSHHPKGKLSLYGIGLARKAYRFRRRTRHAFRLLAEGVARLVRTALQHAHRQRGG